MTADNCAVVVYENEGLSAWVGHSLHSADSDLVWIDFRDGDLVVKNPDKEIVKKLWAIAQSLKAKVQGEEGEIYGADGEIER